MTGAAASLLWSLRMGAAPPGVDTRISARLDSRRRRRRLGGSRRGRCATKKKLTKKSTAFNRYDTGICIRQSLKFAFAH